MSVHRSGSVGSLTDDQREMILDNAEENPRYLAEALGVDVSVVFEVLGRARSSRDEDVLTETQKQSIREIADWCSKEDVIANFQGSPPSVIRAAAEYYDSFKTSGRVNFMKNPIDPRIGRLRMSSGMEDPEGEDDLDRIRRKSDSCDDFLEEPLESGNPPSPVEIPEPSRISPSKDEFLEEKEVEIANLTVTEQVMNPNTYKSDIFSSFAAVNLLSKSFFDIICKWKKSDSSQFFANLQRLCIENGVKLRRKLSVKNEVIKPSSLLGCELGENIQLEGMDVEVVWTYPLDDSLIGVQRELEKVFEDCEDENHHHFVLITVNDRTFTLFQIDKDTAFLIDTNEGYIRTVNLQQAASYLISLSQEEFNIGYLLFGTVTVDSTSTIQIPSELTANTISRFKRLEKDSRLIEKEDEPSEKPSIIEEKEREDKEEGLSLDALDISNGIEDIELDFGGGQTTREKSSQSKDDDLCCIQ